MKDEEKAKEIANKYNQSKDDFGNDFYNIGYEACALEMAAWKQEQALKAFCKVTCKGYKDTGGKCFCDGGCDMYKNFKKEMEE